LDSEILILVLRSLGKASKKGLQKSSKKPSIFALFCGQTGGVKIEGSLKQNLSRGLGWAPFLGVLWRSKN